jgi:hypothetical protein
MLDRFHDVPYPVAPAMTAGLEQRHMRVTPLFDIPRPLEAANSRRQSGGETEVRAR